MSTPEWKPCDWISRCATQLRARDARLEAADAADMAAALYEREGWRGDGPEHAAERHVQSEAALADVRRQSAVLPGAPRHG